MGLPRRDLDRHTYADYRTWVDDHRYELIDGVAYLTPPAPAVVHQTVAFEIAHQARTALEGKPCRVFVAPLDVLLAATDENEAEATTVVQPDVFVVCDPRKIGDKHICGAPDWVVEVLSPSTASHDHILKRRAYESGGVREYWLVHPTDRIVTVYRLANGSYGASDVRELTGETPVSVLPGVVIRWDAIVDRMPRET